MASSLLRLAGVLLLTGGVGSYLCVPAAPWAEAPAARAWRHRPVVAQQNAQAALVDFDDYEDEGELLEIPAVRVYDLVGPLRRRRGPEVCRWALLCYRHQVGEFRRPICLEPLLRRSSPLILGFARQLFIDSG